MTNATVQISPKLVPVFTPARGSVRYRYAHGGRGSSKSFTFAKMAAIFGYAESLKILCCREFQVSIKDSFYAELKSAIESESWLKDAYDIGENYIRSKINDTKFIFKGLHHNINNVKSISGIDICILEEAEDIPDEAFIALEPTIRAAKSEIWVIWNPKIRKSPVDKKFRIGKQPPRTVGCEINYQDNPWFPIELEELRQQAKEKMDLATYQWIWEGKYLENSEIQVMAGKCRVVEFTPKDDWEGPYYGLDFGFANDPTAGVKFWIAKTTLLIEYEAYKVGLELDDTSAYLKECLPDVENHVVRADNARPESISYLRRKGLPKIVACQKGKNSVQDGIEFLKSFKQIIIHPRCTNMQEEANMYQYKVDRLTGEIKSEIVDDYNHLWDALRYGAEPMMKGGGFESLLKASMRGAA